MGRLSQSIRGIKKTDNHQAALPAKVEIRRNVMCALGCGARVFDAFAGSGKMHDAVWRDAASYVGCDLRFFADKRTAFVADNKRVLRSIDLSVFNLFDLDAYGSPWEQVAIISARRTVEPGEKVGLCITEGSGLKLKQGGPPTALALMAGLSGRPAGTSRQHGILIDAAIAGLCKRMGCKVDRRWEAKGRTGAAVVYIGLVLCGVE